MIGEGGHPSFPMENAIFLNLLGKERQKSIEKLPRDLSDFCVVKRSIKNPNDPDEILKGGLDIESWRIIRFKENGSVVAIKKTEKVQVEGQFEVQQKTFEKKDFWAVNFANAEFVLDQLRADFRSSGGKEKERLGRNVKSFYEAEISGILEYIKGKIAALEEYVHKYESQGCLDDYDKKGKAVLAAKTLLEKNMGKASEKIFSQSWMVKNAEFGVASGELAKYQRANSDLEKFITSLHSLLYIETDTQESKKQ
ncbi:MAG: hypothetical protein ACD_18C00177G0001 [uncultured bacterium]|nr:MAG: hypothetical protein ACD_18C00177G0001 [uncultured bacterium]